MRLVPVTVALFAIAAAQVVVQFVLVLTTTFAPGEHSEDPESPARNLNRNNLLEAVISFFSVTNKRPFDLALLQHLGPPRASHCRPLSNSASILEQGLDTRASASYSNTMS